MNKQDSAPLLAALQNYARDDITYFDVPGHKKRKNREIVEAYGEKILKMDANSAPGIDMLSHPSGVIAQAEDLLAEAFGADCAFFLVNGSTSGVQDMILAACGPGEEIILPRNVHKSAVNALILSGAKPVFVQPEIDASLGIANGVTYESVKQAIADHPQAKAVLLINPTYFGVASDIRSIVRLAHRAGMAVLADESHGAHLPFHPDFPVSAMEAGADMSTVSMHKTGGSLTQSSALLLREGRFQREKIRSIVNLMQTTSASYLLMSSLDLARRKLATQGKTIFDRLLREIYVAKREIAALPGLTVLTRDYIDGAGINDYDETKLVIRVNGLGLTGFEAYNLLRYDYRVQPELAETYVILAVASIGDDAQTLSRLVDALRELSRRFYGRRKELLLPLHELRKQPEMAMLPREAFYRAAKLVPLDQADGAVCAESIMIYPPGIPLCIPGEKITREMIEYCKFYAKQDYVVLNDAEATGKIKVIA